jgi:hypothetical protein
VNTPPARAANGKLANYWMGLSNTSAGWRWADGTQPDNFVNDDAPYAHWASGFYSGWVSTECIYGASAKPYSK